MTGHLAPRHTAARSIAQALSTAREQLSRLDAPELEAQLLLSAVLERDRSYLFAFPETLLTPPQQQRLERWLQRRSAGEALAYLTGRREFWSLDLAVTRDTLIPRPETETLVEQALARIPTDARWTLADLGTGSGAIALALASERPGCRVTAIERSAAALAVALDNAQRLGLGNVRFSRGDWLDAVGAQSFDLIAANPPYIAIADPQLEAAVSAHEPAAALTSGVDGLDDIRHIIATAGDHLRPGGWLLLEHGYAQADKVLDLLSASGYDSVRDYRDLAGLARVAAARNPTAGADPQTVGPTPAGRAQ